LQGRSRLGAERSVLARIWRLTPPRWMVVWPR